MKIVLEFADPISEAYRQKLQTFSDNVLAHGITDNRPPRIDFDGMNQGTYNEIIVLQHTYDDITAVYRKLKANEIHE